MFLFHALILSGINFMLEAGMKTTQKMIPTLPEHFRKL